MPVVIAFLLVVTGCATSGSLRSAKPGDIADIHFQCMLQSGEIAAATDDKTIKKDLPRANIYIVRDKAEPVSVIVKSPSDKPVVEKERIFEDDIVAGLAPHLTGMKEGETRHVELTAQDNPLRTKEDYVISLARIRQKPKEIKITIDEYKSRMGKSPKTGQVFFSDSAITGRVEAVTEKEVIIRFSIKEGAVIKTPFGDGRVREEADSYKIDIDARKGSLVRSAHLVGRITDVDDKSMTLDYRNPFGGETLSCDVTANRITEDEAKQDKTVEK
jgi:FKBP-type peptidyl-prolyl cis-trans isomerase 2